MSKATLENGTKMITEKENKKAAAFFRSRLPLDYHDNKRSLSSEGEHGERVLAWISADGLRKISERGMVIEVVGKSAKSRDIFYLTARALILRSVSVQCGYPIDFLPDRLTEQLREDISERGLLALDKMGWESKSFLDSAQTYEVEVFIERWLNSGRSLLIRSEASLSVTPQWSDEFKNFLKRRLSASFIVG